MFASSVWAKLFKAQPLNRHAGDVVRREVLSKGSAGDPLGMLTTVLGAPPDKTALLAEIKEASLLSFPDKMKIS